MLSFLVVLIASELAVFSGLPWIAALTGYNLFTFYVVCVFGLIAIFAFGLSWGKSKKNGTIENSDYSEN